MKAIIGYGLVLSFAVASFGLIVKPAATLKAKAIQTQMSERQKMLNEL